MERQQASAGGTTRRIKRDRKELLSRYATASVFLYGVISVDEFVEVFNHYEDVKTDPEEAVLALRRLEKTNDVEYSVFKDMISGPAFQPRFMDYEENVSSIRQRQNGKPRYLPEKEEFLRYETGDYTEPLKPYADLKAYILKNRLMERGEGLKGVDGDLIDLKEMIHEGFNTVECLKYFTESDYVFDGIDDLNSFVQVLLEVFNNTRIYENNGFTPEELFKRSERTNLIPFSEKVFVRNKSHKVGRNDPCPCGSGKKYKKCCGR